MIVRPARCALLLAVLAGIAAGACTRHQDRFWPDTDRGLLALSSPRVLAGDPERLILQHSVGGRRDEAVILRLSHALQVGDRVVASVSVPTVGEYRSGGGWIFKGRKCYGRYGVAGDLLQVSSDHPEVLAASSDPHGNLELAALAPGTSRVTLSATMSRRYADRPPDAETFTDTLAVTVDP